MIIKKNKNNPILKYKINSYFWKIEFKNKILN